MKYLFRALLLVSVVRAPVLAAEVSLIAHFLDESDSPVGEEGTVLRFELDLNGDGSQDIFLANSQKGTAGERWLVYVRRADGKVSYAGKLFFHDRSFYYTPSDLILGTKRRLSADVVGFQRYKFTGLDFEFQATGYGTDSEEDARIAAWQRDYRPAVVWSDLKDFASGGQAIWRKFDGSEPDSRYGALPETVVEP